MNQVCVFVWLKDSGERKLRLWLFKTCYMMDRDQVNRLVEGLQGDLKSLILETRKKYPTVKEVTYYFLHF